MKGGIFEGIIAAALILLSLNVPGQKAMIRGQVMDSIDITQPAGELLEILLPIAAIDLKVIDVVGKKPIFTLKGDTVQFNAADFTIHTGAMAEDLFRKIPGMVVENGTITAMG
ncbi:MAG: hypothetical protein PHD61_08165 [Bacteroidales bacterium]|nr:hypothetical protein [Lentimicrobiaceae bacterium]MDD5695265.1 hypothetical protein [Bacteroidales bacterium]